MKTTDNSYRRRSHVRHRSVGGDGVVVVQGEHPEVLITNRVGARILECVDGATPVAAIVDVLLEEFEVERATLERDVEVYLGELLDAGVIERRQP